jgi:hypothetical protein
MKSNRDDNLPLDFMESELDRCLLFLDLAGRRPTANILATVRRGYESAVYLIGSVRDPGALGRMTAKLNRLRERLFPLSPSGSATIPVKAVG